ARTGAGRGRGGASEGRRRSAGQGCRGSPEEDGGRGSAGRGQGGSGKSESGRGSAGSQEQVQISELRRDLGNVREYVQWNPWEREYKSRRDHTEGRRGHHRWK